MDKTICPICGKEMTVKDELEYSEEYCTLYCSPDCAMSDYFDRARSIKVDERDKQKYLERFGGGENESL